MLKKTRKKLRKTLKKIRRAYHKFNILLLVVVFSTSLSFPQHSLALNNSKEKKSKLKLQGILIEPVVLPIPKIPNLNTNQVSSKQVEAKHLPKTNYKKIKLSKRGYITAYNVGVVAQTDNTPCIGASGDNLCKMVAQGQNVCAANFVRLGTYLEIENIGKCIVLDRMNARYNNAYPPRIDFAMGPNEIAQAKQFGLKYRKFTIY